MSLFQRMLRDWSSLYKSEDISELNAASSINDEWNKFLEFSLWFYFRTIYEVYCENIFCPRRFFLDFRKEGGIVGRFYCGIITLSLLSPRFDSTFDFFFCLCEGRRLSSTHIASSFEADLSAQRKQIKTNEFNA